MKIYHVKLTVLSTPGGVLYDQFQTYNPMAKPLCDMPNTPYYYIATNGAIHQCSTSTLATAVITEISSDDNRETDGGGPILSALPTASYTNRLYKGDPQMYLRPEAVYSQDQSMSYGLFCNNTDEPILVKLRGGGLVWHPKYQGWLYAFDLIEVSKSGLVTVIGETFYTYEHHLIPEPAFREGQMVRLIKGFEYQPADGYGVPVGDPLKAQRDPDVHVIDVNYVEGQWRYYLSFKDPREGTEFGDLNNRLYAFESSLVSNRR